MENVWYETDRKDNAVATATHAAEPGVKHVITGIYASYSGTANGTLTIKEGATVKATLDMQNQVSIDKEMEFASGEAVTVELSASGSAGVYGSLLVNGYTK
jgi:hypothetical protein